MQGKYNLMPGCPNLIERIEGGLLSYGNEFTRDNNPIECNFEKFIPFNSNHQYIGKLALTKIRNNGVKKKIRGVLFDGDPCPVCSDPFPVFSKNGEMVGQITSGIYSPHFKKNVGLSMIKKDHWNIGNEIIVKTPDKIERLGIISYLPFKLNKD